MVPIFLLFIAFLSIFPEDLNAQKCAEKLYPGAFRNQVCVCNSTFCDQIEPVGNEIPEGEIVVYRSSLEGDRMNRFVIKFGDIPEFKVNTTILIDASQKYQKIMGFGGAFTDSAGENLAAIPQALQDQILRAYFGPNGLEYNLGRVPIASCDFSTHEYSYDDSKEDYELKAFKLAREDLELKIPFILRAKTLAPNLQLFASPWSAPGWMKTTGKMQGGGSLRNSTKIYASYANYFVMFFEEYQKRHVDFWGVTIQNEPSTGADLQWRWQGMNFTGETMRDFLRDYLGPVLKKSEVTRDLKVMILDDGRGLLPGWADSTFNDSIATQFADGIAVHWYGNLYSPPILLDITQKRHPDKFILATEACTGYFGHRGPIFGDWFRAESYADDILTDLNHWVTGWVDWNLVLDEAGGPNWVLNLVDAPIIVNRTAGEFYKQPMFYAMAHFSKFFPRNSTRIDTKIKGSQFITATSVSISGGRRATVILNRGNSSVSTRISDVGTKQSALIEIAPRSIHTLLWDKKKSRKIRKN
ncbi:unnamed protein product [Caenorhabditis angaria]|uniref:Glucosylceramidase n=1 Tax=Caenorhabditis angaria TaxID=860376 RepID=A0A9P1IKY8_9PELO|nr:unnamed protein product [Caenorhabditis angaria]